MPSREERVAQNEAAARAINEEIEDKQAVGSGAYLMIVCECGDRLCEEALAITKAEYEEVRSDPIQFVLRHDHVNPTVDDQIKSTDRFVVVAKREGIPAMVAEDTDPRG